MTQIRNIIQGHGERETVKTCPDMVLYIEGVPYVINPWMVDEFGNNQIVNINDFVTSVSINAGVEHMIPTCSISLSIPNHLRSLFQAPGGNTLLNTMDEVQAYCKGYFISKEGRSIYHRVFHGLITSITCTDTPTSLDISLSCDGVLKLLEMMLWVNNPAVGNIGGMEATVYNDVLGKENPYSQLASMFLSSTICSKQLGASLLIGSITQVDPKGHEYFDALAKHYIIRWQEKLDKVSKMVHMFGLPKESMVPDLIKVRREQEDSKDPRTRGTTRAVNKDNIQQALAVYEEEISKYLPSMGVGQLELLNSNVTNRLEKLRTIAELIQYEIFQDLSGDIIMKPPLFNLDVTHLNGEDPNLFPENNPFVIYPSEVESEQRTEDQSQITATRTSVQGAWSVSQQLEGGRDLLNVGTYCDVRLTSKFGLRDKPIKQLGFLPNDSHALFSLAISELVRSNRSYKTYTCTIPIRPEIKLGFPVFITHHDMYAYPRSISITYNVGGNANMTLNCDSIRCRPMVPTVVTVKDDTANPPYKMKEDVKTTVYKSIPNLVYKWTTPVVNGKSALANPTGDQASPRVTTEVSNDKKRYRAWRSKKLANLFEVEADNTQKSWRVQNGDEGAFSIKSPHHTLKKTPDGKIIYADKAYQELLRTTQPYTDEKGYELIGPFPWGRWVALEDAIRVFTEDGRLWGNSDSEGKNSRITKPGNAFLYAGLGSPSGVGRSNWTTDKKTGALNSFALDQVAQDITSPYIKSFELDYHSPEGQVKSPIADVAPEMKNPQSKDEELQKQTLVMLNIGADTETFIQNGWRNNLDVTLASNPFKIKK